MSDIDLNRVVIGDCRETLRDLPPDTFQTCVTSPPYWGLRDYGHEDQIGLESSPDEYVAELVSVFREVRRVLRPDGTLWLNLGDSYANCCKGTGGPSEKQTSNAGSRFDLRRFDLKPKDLVGIPWRAAFALQADGWWLRSDIIWAKPNPMPESVTDRPTKAHEYVFLMAKSDRYWFDQDAIREPANTDGWTGVSQASHVARRATISGGTPSATMRTAEDGNRNPRSVWTIATHPYSGAHFATMPEKLAERCIMAGSRIGDAVLDPFFGSGTTGKVAEILGRKWLGCELNPKYEALIKERTAQAGLPFGGEAA